MADAVIDFLKAHFRQLRLPTMGQEFERVGDPGGQHGDDPDQERGVPGLEGLRDLRFQHLAAALQAESVGVGAVRVD